MTNCTRVIAAACAGAFLLAGCGGGNEPPDVTVPRIKTTALTDAVTGSDYSFTLQASGGSKPYTWSISSQLTWLTIEPTTGNLGGKPPALAAAVGVNVQVEDGSGLIDTRILNLEVVSCQSDTAGSCYYSDGTACYLGSHHCTDGSWGSCDPYDPGPVYTTEFTHCGAGCGSCSTAADNCTYGLCRCDSASACAGGNVCCGVAGCKNIQTDADNCGDCNRVCAGAAHANRHCSNGACGLTCQSGWGDCTSSPGCETSITTRNNCGRCGRVCPADRPTCTGGECCGWVGYPATYECS